MLTLLPSSNDNKKQAGVIGHHQSLARLDIKVKKCLLIKNTQEMQFGQITVKLRNQSLGKQAA